MINVIAHLRQDLMNQLRGFKQNPESAPQGQAYILDAIANMLDLEGQLGWWKNHNDGQTWIPVSLLLTPGQLVDLTGFGAGNRVDILKAVNMKDGTDYGQTLSYDIDGNPVISGDPIYPDNTAAFLGEKAVFDQDGNQVGTAPMVLNEHPQWLGCPL